MMRVHRILGYIALLPALYMALTGIASALAEQIERIIEPELFSVQPIAGKALPESAIKQIVSRTLGDIPFQLHRGEGIFDTWQVHYTRNEQRVLWIHPYSGMLLADKEQARRVSEILVSLHNGSFFSANPLIAVFTALALFASCTGLCCFLPYRRGSRYWHIQYALLAIPAVFILSLSGLFAHWFGVTNLVSQLHSNPNIVLRLLYVVSLILFILSLVSSLKRNA